MGGLSNVKTVNPNTPRTASFLGYSGLPTGSASNPGPGFSGADYIASGGGLSGGGAARGGVLTDSRPFQTPSTGFNSAGNSTGTILPVSSAGGTSGGVVDGAGAGGGFSQSGLQAGGVTTGLVPVGAGISTALNQAGAGISDFFANVPQWVYWALIGLVILYVLSHWVLKRHK